jgi:YVTN family beta-propeller protein
LADVFLSYSRRDGEFAQRLTSALQERGKAVWFDVEGIRDAEVFPEALRRAIEASDGFVFVISPDSVRSSFCVEEAEDAARLNKRIVPLALRPVRDGEVPEGVRVRNWISAGAEWDFETTVSRVVKALDTDLEWERRHSRLTVRALEWEQSGRDRSFLLRGADLKEAERWLAAGVDKDPGPTALEREYVVAGRQRARRSRVVASAGGAVLLALVAMLVALLAAPGAGVHVGLNSVAAINPRTNTVVGSASVGSRPGAIAFGSGSLWVANVADQTVSRVDPKTLQASQAIPVGNPPTGIAAGAQGVWVAASTLNPYAYIISDARNVSVSRIDPQFNTVGSAVRIANAIPGPVAVAAQGNGVWVAPSAGLLTRIDQSSGRIVHQLDPHANASALAVGDGGVWMTDESADNVTRIDPTGRRTSIAVGNGPSGIAVGAGGVWVADSLDDKLVRIDPSRRVVTNTILVGRSPVGVAVGAGSVWVANSGDGTVSRINPRTDRVIATVAVGGSPQQLALAHGRLWVTIDARTAAAGGGAGGGTLRIDALAGVGSMDPALAGGALDMQLLQATCLKLMNFPDKPGPAGLVPTPEAANSLPAVSPDGRTYTFAIRPGFRFSPPSNQPVTAQTFKDTLERTFNPRMKSGYGGDFADIAGFGAYAAGKVSHISGITARGDTLTIRLLAPNPDLLARLAGPYACAVPTDTPINPNGVNVIPMAGPYYVKSYTPGQGVVLVRNPNYHGSRPHHFARIEVTAGFSAAQAIAAVKGGTADNMTFASFSGSGLSTAGIAAEAARLAAHYGPGSAAAKSGRQQYFVHPSLELDYFILNTHRPLFSSVRMRQAVGYAIDRRALAALGNPTAPLPEHATDHYLPPGMLGYRDVPVYPLSPDLAKARALANGHGRTAVLYTCNVPPCPEQVPIIKTDLAAIGLRVKIKAFSYPTMIAREARPGERYDIGYTNWFTDFPDPYSMLNELLETSAISPTFDDPTWQRKLAAAARLSGPQRYLTYGKLDLDLARHAGPLLAYGNVDIRDFFSARIGCQTYNNYDGMDLAALCLRARSR